jgi:hypothetical protein
MLSSKSKVLSAFVLASLMFILTQIPTASAKSKIPVNDDSNKLAPEACVPAPSGLVSWYRAEGNANDSQGTNHGSFIGGGSFTAGKVGQSFSITPTQVVGVADNATLDFTNAFTIEMWVNPSAAGTSDGRTAFISKGNLNFANTQSYAIIFNANRQIFNRVGNGSTLDQAASTSQLPLNTFTHIATTYDGTTLRVYVNGVLETSQATSIGTLLNTSEGLIIGGANFSGIVLGTEAAIDETSLYNRALSDVEIQSIFNADSAGKCLAPTAASVLVGGRVVTASGSGIGKARLALTNGAGVTRFAQTNNFGYYRFLDVPAGEAYVIGISHKAYEFDQPSRLIIVNEETESVNFTANK